MEGLFFMCFGPDHPEVFLILPACLVLSWIINSIIWKYEKRKKGKQND